MYNSKLRDARYFAVFVIQFRGCVRSADENRASLFDAPPLQLRDELY